MDISYILIAIFTTLTLSLATTLSTQEENPQDNLEKIATANNELALNLYHQLSAESSENLFFSPLSLSTAFGMLYYGTRGNTAEELRSVLGYEKADLPEYLVHETFQQYLAEVLPSQDASAYILNSANSILLDEKLDLEPSYKSEVQELYLALVEEVDFVNDSQKIVEDVNSWVNKSTNGKIDKLLDTVDPFSAMVILNAIYFKGTWKSQFERRYTRISTFYNYGLESEAKEVPTMRMIDVLNYNSMPNAEVVELPYKGENISMVILLPRGGYRLEDVEGNLTPEKLRAIRGEMTQTNVALTLPKFKIEYSAEMAGDFQSLGALSIFSPGANFSGMTSSNNIYVSQIQHKAVLEVNEEGSEAAGMTRMVVTRSLPEFDVNHPFLFAIVDTRNDMIIFMGRVVYL